MDFVRICKGLNDVGELIPADEFYSDKVWNYITNPEKQDWYKSIFFYNEDHKKTSDQIVDIEKNGKKYKRKRGVGGIEDVYTNRLVFDFDHEDGEVARKSVVELSARLLEQGIPVENQQISFSGSKGFHIEVEIDKRLNVKEFKNIVFNLASDLPAFDEKIWNPARIFRIPLTTHKSTGLYKFPLSFLQLSELPVDVIREMASDRNNVDDEIFNGWHGVALPQHLLSLKDTEKKEEKVYESVEHDLDLTNKPKWLTEARYALQEGYFREGDRNTAFMVLASVYKAQGFNKDIVYRMLKGVAERQAKRNGCDRYGDEQLWNNIVEYIFNGKYDATENSYKNNELLNKISKELSLKTEKDSDNLISVESVSDVFRTFAQDIDKNTVKLGITSVDNEVRVTTSMLVCLLAAPSAGKTSISLNILNAANKNAVNSMFFSLDMGAPLVFQRLIQKHLRLKSDEIFDIYKNGNKEMMDKIDGILTEEYKRTRFCFRSGISVDDMRDYIIENDNKTGEKTKLIVVDYLECLQGPYSDSTANTSVIAQKLKDLANELAITIVLLVQPQKHAGDPSSELLSYRQIKGSSAIEQAASVIFTIWRPGFSAKDPVNDRYMSLAVVKNRMGGLAKFDFRWNGLTGRIEDLEEYEREELLELIERKELEKAKKDDF